MENTNQNWSYNEFLAFLLVFGAQMSLSLSAEELAYIQAKTGITDIAAIKAKVDSISDMEGLEIIEEYREQYINTKEDEIKAKRDLEALLQTGGLHSQLEKVAVHMIEKLL